jgi:hypothetical protein
MNDLELMKKDVLRFALGTAKLAQPHLHLRKINSDLRHATRLIRKAKTMDHYEKAVHYFQQLYREIYALENYLGEKAVDGVYYGSRTTGDAEESI